MQDLLLFIAEKAIAAPDDLMNKDLTDHGFVHVHSWHDIIDHHIYRHPERKIDLYYNYHASRCVVYFPDGKQPGDLFAKLCRLEGAFQCFDNTLAFTFTFWLFGILLLELGIAKPKPKKENTHKKKKVQIEDKPVEVVKQEPPQNLFSI